MGWGQNTLGKCRFLRGRGAETLEKCSFWVGWGQNTLGKCRFWGFLVSSKCVFRKKLTLAPNPEQMPVWGGKRPKRVGKSRYLVVGTRKMQVCWWLAGFLPGSKPRKNLHSPSFQLHTIFALPRLSLLLPQYHTSFPYSVPTARTALTLSATLSPRQPSHHTPPSAASASQHCLLQSPTHFQARRNWPAGLSININKFHSIASS